MPSEGRTRTVRRLGWLRGDGGWRVRAVDPEARVIDEDTAEAYERMLASTERALDLMEGRVVAAMAKVDAVLGRTKDRRQRDDLLDIRLSLTGRTTS